MHDSRERTIRPSVAIAMLLLAFSSSAHAVDGVIEINQARALAGGVTAGDAAGFPVTISQSGSYVLTGDLAVSSAGVDGIKVETTDVAIDLNGFSISGPVTCTGSGSTLECSSTAFGPSGINARISLETQHDRITVRNGAVRGFSDTGVWVGSDSRIEQVTVEENGRRGINCGDCVINRNVISRNVEGFSGDGVVTNNIANGNKGDGFSGRGVFQGNSADGNGRHGLAVCGSVIENFASNNGSSGIECLIFRGGIIRSNVSLGNGFDGIRTTTGSLVEGNKVDGNDRFGLELDPRSGYKNNNIQTGFGSMGTVSGGINLGGNVCETNTTCP